MFLKVIKRRKTKEGCSISLLFSRQPPLSTLVFVLISIKPDLKSTMKKMPFSANDRYISFNSGIIYVKSNKLCYINTKGETTFELDIGASDFSLYASEGALAVYSAKSVQVISSKGELLFKIEPKGTVKKRTCKFAERRHTS